MAPVTGAAVLAQLPPGRGSAVVRDGDATIVAIEPTAVRSASGEDAFARLDEAARDGFWIGYLAYDLGRHVERVRTRIPDDLRLPDLVLARYDARLVLEPGEEPRVVGDGPTAALLAQAAWRARREQAPRGPRADERVDVVVGSGGVRPRGGHHPRAARRGRVLPGEPDAATREPPRPPIPSASTRRSTAWNPAPHAALCTFGPHLPALAVVSASPELFLRVDGRRVVTRPIKGTAADRATLAASAKDHAENVMIVDLARNDLGRVCEYGSITVPELCAIESHPGLHHLVSTVEGTLRPGVGLDALVRATFPPASITGAPKPRVMQAIEDLEPVRRGVYCGAVGWIDGDTDRAELAVAIRTFTIVPGATYLGVGGGIVADSNPDAEWAETELKAARLLAAAAGGAVDAGIR